MYFIPMLFTIDNFNAACANLALNKPSVERVGESAATTVDGIYTVSSEVLNQELTWWIVNLQTKYSIGKIQLYGQNGKTILL